MLKPIYKGLKDRLSNIPDVYVDYFLGQYLQAEGGSVLYNEESLFIEFMPIAWDTHRRSVQRGVLSFKVHAVTTCLYDDEDRILGTTVFNHMDLVNEVFKHLQNFRITEQSGNVLLESVVRKQTIPDHELEVVVVTIQEFEAVIFDYTAAPVYTHVSNVAFEVTPEIKERI